MNKILRYSLVSLLTLLCGSVFADEATFDFTTVDGLTAMGVSASSIPSVAASADDGQAFETTGPFSVNGVTISATNGSTNSRIWSPKGNDGTKYDFRVYGNANNPGTITFTAPSGKYIVAIELTTGTWNEPSPSTGAFSGKTWTGSANSVTFTQEKQCQYKNVVVTFNSDGSGTVEPTPTPTLPEADSQISTTTAWEAINGLDDGGKTSSKYYVKGIITYMVELSTDYGNTTFWMADQQGSNYQVEVFRAKGFDNQSITDPNFVKEGDEVIVYGVLQKYKDKEGNITYEISSCYITSVNGKTGEDTPTQVAEAGDIARLEGMTNNTSVKLTLNNAVVVQAWESSNGNKQVFVRDETGACQFYNIGFDLNIGDVLNGTVTATYKLYNGNPELEKATENNLSISAGASAPQAKKIEIGDADKNLCDYVELANVSIKEVEPEATAKETRASVKYYAIDDSDNQIQLYNRFHYDTYNDLHEFLDQTDKTKVKGIVMKMSGGDLELYIMEILSPTGITTLSSDMKANGAIYNMAGQRVENAVKGVYIQNGKKFIVK